jgi:hypothetical protein
VKRSVECRGRQKRKGIDMEALASLACDTDAKDTSFHGKRSDDEGDTGLPGDSCSPEFPAG